MLARRGVLRRGSGFACGDSLRALAAIAALALGALSAGAARPVDAAVPPGDTIGAGVGVVDITPTGSVVLAGSPTTLKSDKVGSRLFVKALVLSAGGAQAAIVTLDTLKYPVEHVLRARERVEQVAGIAASHVIVCASHTHRGPLWSHYEDRLATPIAEAVALAVRDVGPCRVGIARGRVEGVSECRRVIKDGRAWNRWQLAPGEADRYPAEGPADPDCGVLALIRGDGRFKAVVYNFACHAANARDLAISADFPGEVERNVQRGLGYQVPALFLPGACGDVNPVYGVPPEVFGARLGGEIVRGLGNLESVARPTLAMESREIEMPAREHPEFMEAEIARNWPAQVEHYRASFREMMTRAKPDYRYIVAGIRIGDDFAVVTHPVELFCEIGMNIRKQSPFRHTMVVEQANGAHGYVPTARALEGGSYETWFGEHSYLTTNACEIAAKESFGLLGRLKGSKPAP